MADIQYYTAITGASISNKIVTFPNGLQALTALNVGDVDATITFYDGYSIPLRRNGGVFSIADDPRGYKTVSIDATGTTIDFAVTGIAHTSITYTNP